MHLRIFWTHDLPRAFGSSWQSLDYPCLKARLESPRNKLFLLRAFQTAKLILTQIEPFILKPYCIYLVPLSDSLIFSPICIIDVMGGWVGVYLHCMGKVTLKRVDVHNLLL